MDEYIARLSAAATEAEAIAITAEPGARRLHLDRGWAHVGRGRSYTRDLVWMYWSNLSDIRDSYVNFSMGEWVHHFDDWREATRGVQWRAQLHAELEAIDQGRVPETIGPEPWLLCVALFTERCDLADALLEAGAVPDGLCIGELADLAHKPELIRAVLSKAVEIPLYWLSSLLGSDVIAFTLPYLNGFSLETLKQSCRYEDLKTLHEATGVSLDDPNMLFDIFTMSRVCFASVESVRYIASHVALTEEVLNESRKCFWYWVLYATEEERQAVLASAPALAPHVSRWFDDPDNARDDRIEWNEACLRELPDLPAGVAFTLLRHTGPNDACRTFAFCRRRTRALRALLIADELYDWLAVTFA